MFLCLFFSYRFKQYLQLHLIKSDLCLLSTKQCTSDDRRVLVKGPDAHKEFLSKRRVRHIGSVELDTDDVLLEEDSV